MTLEDVMEDFLSLCKFILTTRMWLWMLQVMMHGFHFMRYVHLGYTSWFLLDHIAFDDICCTLYNDHHQTGPLEMISWYSGWLTYGSQLMYSNQHNRIPQKFKYLHGIHSVVAWKIPGRINTWNKLQSHHQKIYLKGNVNKTHKEQKIVGAIKFWFMGQLCAWKVLAPRDICCIQ